MSGKPKTALQLEADERFAEIELAIAQLAAGLSSAGWRPRQQGQLTLARIVDRAQARHQVKELDAFETRPQSAPEQRKAGEPVQ